MQQENIGKFIASLRKEKHLTQEQLAERLGANNRSVSRWETGTCMPDYGLLPLLAKELGVSVVELLDGKKVSKVEYFMKEDAYMENYKILIEATQKEKAGLEFSEQEKLTVVESLLNGIACKEDVKKYKLRMRVNPSTDNIYPNFYIPPYNGNKKLRLADGYLPKTHILYANSYELEILRLLHRLIPENEAVQEMIGQTVQRVKNTCYGNNCLKGECVNTGKYVLRFLEAVQPKKG